MCVFIFALLLPASQSWEILGPVPVRSEDLVVEPIWGASKMCVRPMAQFSSYQITKRRRLRASHGIVCWANLETTIRSAIVFEFGPSQKLSHIHNFLSLSQTTHTPPPNHHHRHPNSLCLENYNTHLSKVFEWACEGPNVVSR